ncbi:MAG: biotin--[acetyl-CoA-carboxylase] ligase [Myxococcota bacterium]
MSAPASGAAAVLAALRAEPRGAVSGALLSERLGVTRAQIWKHVEALRKRGYAIEGEPGGGYRLVAAPDRLYAEEVQRDLKTRWVGHAYDYHETTDSTNRVAFELGRRGAEHGTAVVAEAQTAGRGRLGRAFFSPPHANLYTSIVLRPTCSIADAPTLILGAAIAVADTVAAFVDDPEAVAIKWPNDVLLHDRKTSGILMESSTEGARIAFAVLGIGVNLNVDRTAFPEDFRDGATSLSSELGRAIDRTAFTRGLFAALEAQLDAHAQGGFEALRPRFERYFRMAGSRVAVDALSGGRIEGRARGIAANGALEIEVESDARPGEIVEVMAGDVTLAKRPRDGR